VAGWTPRPDAAEALCRDPCDVSGRGIGKCREHNVGPEIGVGEALEDLGGAALAHAGGAVHDEVFEQPPLVRDGRRNRERDARVAAEIPQLPLVREGGKDDLVTIEPDPGGRDLRPSIFVERDHVRNRVALEQGAGDLGERDSSHGSMLAACRTGLRLAGSPRKSPGAIDRSRDPPLMFERGRRQLDPNQAVTIRA